MDRQYLAAWSCTLSDNDFPPALAVRLACWRQRVCWARRQPLVRLEVGGTLLPTLRLPAAYVRAPQTPPPLVLLLACDTASTGEDFANEVRYFRQAGAAAVVPTIATVFGAHAVRVGEKNVRRLLAANAVRSERLGEVLRDGEAMRESLPMALCVVASGDADWRL